MSNGEWTFFTSESQEVCLPEPWDGFLKVDFLPVQEPGPGTGRPICIFYQPLILHVPARVVHLKETHEGFPRPAYILNLLSLCLRALWKNTSDIHECISMDKNLNSLLNHNNHTYSSTCNQSLLSIVSVLVKCSVFQPFRHPLKHKITELLRSNQQSY